MDIDHLHDFFSAWIDPLVDTPISNQKVFLNQIYFTIMRYTLYIFGFGSLLLGLFLYFRRRARKIQESRIRRNRNNYYIRGVLPEGGHVSDDRIEFHCTKRTQDP